MEHSRTQGGLSGELEELVQRLREEPSSHPASLSASDQERDRAVSGRATSAVAREVRDYAQYESLAVLDAEQERFLLGKISSAREVFEMREHLERESSSRGRGALPPSTAELAAALGVSEAECRRRLSMADEALELLVGHNIRMVHHIARQYTDQGVEHDDLVQCGLSGLITGIQRYDPSHGTRLMTYATWWIRCEMRRAIAREGKTVRLPEAIHWKVKKMKAIARRLGADGEDAPPAAVARELGMEEKEVQAILDVNKSVAVQSGSTASYDGVDSILDQVAEEQAEAEGDALSRSGEEGAPRSDEIDQELQNLLSTLHLRERNILKMHFGLTDHGRKMSPRDIAIAYGISQQRILKIQEEAIAKLRARQSADPTAGIPAPDRPPASQNGRRSRR